MAPKKALKASAKVENEEPKPDPLRVSNLYEAGALKGALDDLAREVILEEGYLEELMISNVKLLLGFAAIGVALYAQFGPGKFPANWWTVFGCVVAYIVLTIVMNLYSWQVEKDAFLVTKPFKGTSLRVSSRMDRWSEQYTLVLTDRTDDSLEVHTTYDISRYFHADGFVAEEAWRGEVSKLLEKLRGQREGVVAKKTN